MALRIGAILPHPAYTIEHARLAEVLGFDFVGAGEHIFRDRRPGPTQEALSALATAAGATTRVRLLSSIAILPLHHPVLMAKEAAVVDAASNGRLTLGVGVGGEFPAEFQALNIPVRERGSRTDEAIRIMKRLWMGKSASHQGRHFAFEGLTLDPPPAQAAGPPLWVGGRTEPAMRRAARRGDGWLPYLYHPRRYAQSVQQVSEMLTAEGRDAGAFSWGLHLMGTIADSYEEARDMAAAGLQAGYLFEGDYAKLAERYCLIGTAEQCLEQLQAFEEAGAQDVLLSWLAPAERVSDQIQRVGEAVLPRMHSDR